MTPEHMKTTPEDIDLDRMKDDTISRQAVIDLLKQMRKDGDMVPWEGKDVFARIRKLPSAQPEEDCDTCKHGYFGGTWCNNCKVRFPSHYERRTDG